MVDGEDRVTVSDGDQPQLSQLELEAMAADCCDDDVENLSDDDLRFAVTFSQYLTDRCVAELQKRGQLGEHDGMIVIPYSSEHVVESPLTQRVQ